MSWYCPLPFNSLSSEPLGKYALCCESAPSPHHCDDMTISQFKNSEYMQNVREGFKSDDPLSVPEIASACSQCKLKEDQGVRSKRQRELYGNNGDSSFIIDNKRNRSFMELKLIGNICNYACLMCTARSSSKIAEAEGLSLPKYFNHSDEWWDDFKEVSKEYSYFKFSGGEPFMSPTTKKILKILVNSGRSEEVSLQFNTNGSASKRVVEKLLKSFKHVQISFSIDAWGERNSLIRKHSDWNFTEDRLWDYADLISKYSNISMSIHPCVSILNIGYLYEFKPFAKEFASLQAIEFSATNTLAYPLYYNAAYLPNKIKKVYLENNYEFLSGIYCRNSKSAINILKSDNEDLAKFKLGIAKIPNYKKWYPEFKPYD